MLGLDIKSRTPRILLIADNLWNPGRAYARALRQFGYQVFHAGRGAPDLDIGHFPTKNLSYAGPFGRHQTVIRQFKLKSLLDLIGIDFDLIFHIQDWSLPMGKSPIAYYFVCTEAMLPICPQPTTVALAATDAIKRIICRDNTSIHHVGYLPHALPGFFPKNAEFPVNERPINTSFAGEIYTLYEAYADRRKIVQTLSKIMDGFEGHWMGPDHAPDGRQLSQEERVPEMGQGRLGPEAYVTLYQNSKVGLNIPTAAGANFRDVEIPSFGAMLVTRETPDHKLMGFEDNVNCRFFDGTPEDAQAKCEDYSEDIARAGWELVVHGRTWTDEKGQEWHVDGHTLYPRMKQLGVFFQRFSGVTPPNVNYDELKFE